VSEIEQLNFEEIPPGTVLARVRSETLPLEVLDEDGLPVHLIAHHAQAAVHLAAVGRRREEQQINRLDHQHDRDRREDQKEVRFIQAERHGGHRGFEGSK
jgi:hypothetical protein